MNKRIRSIKCVTAIILLILVICFMAAGIVGFRLDFNSGSHKITPTAVDKTFFGHYRVYFRTSEYTSNQQEDCYYIEEGHDDIADKIKECIKGGKDIIVYYDSYVGWKGFGAPESAPITSIEIASETEWGVIQSKD